MLFCTDELTASLITQVYIFPPTEDQHRGGIQMLSGFVGKTEDGMVSMNLIVARPLNSYCVDDYSIRILPRIFRGGQAGRQTTFHSFLSPKRVFFIE